MEKDTIDKLFEDLKGEFDTNSPGQGHEKRFLEKLQAGNLVSNTKKSSRFNWKPLAIAASLVICFSIFIGVNDEQEVMDLASVSPELSETQDFFTTTIETELKKLNQENSPLAKKIVKDAIKHIEFLEIEYENLKRNLTENGNDQRIIYAMITNFQSRIDILNNVIEEIENIKQLNIISNETTHTI